MIRKQAIGWAIALGCEAMMILCVWYAVLAPYRAVPVVLKLWVP